MAQFFQSTLTFTYGYWVLIVIEPFIYSPEDPKILIIISLHDVQKRELVYKIYVIYTEILTLMKSLFV